MGVVTAILTEAPGKWNFSIDQGSYWSAQFSYEDTLGNLVDLTGWEAQMEARTAIDDPNVAFALGTSAAPKVPNPDGTITLGGVAGTILLELLPAATVPIGGLVRVKYVYDLELVPPDLNTFKLLQGAIMVNPEVTR